MSPGRRQNAPNPPTERIFVEPAARREAMLNAICSAKQRLVLSLFRCNDYGILDALAAALDRGVSVEAILTKRAKGGRKPLKKLWEALEEMGALVHWYADPVVKYHAKYLLADGNLALIATLNPTTKCFTRTLDFVYTTNESGIVRSISTLFALDAAGERVLPRHRINERLIIGPEGSRERMRELINSAAKTIRLLDHKLSDPDLVSLLRERRDAGIKVNVLGRQSVGSYKAHGKLLIIDDARAVLGSMAMSALSLDFRREVSIVIEERVLVQELVDYFDDLTGRVGDSVLALPGDRAV
jgi:phosphatidylserine/phosphatidylglycerophosphate/cardiolipin synthase-like enzyme